MNRRLALVILPVLCLTGLTPARAAAPASGLPLDLSTSLNIDCVAPGNAWPLADCKDSLRSTYVEETMPKAGKVTIGSTVFTWPTMPLQGADTMQSAGQVLPANGAKGWRSVAVLCAFRSGNMDAGNMATINVKYTDGSSERVFFRAYDWKAHPDRSVYPGVRVQTIATPLFTEGRLSKALAPVNPNKGIKSVEMPQTVSPALLVWAVSLSKEQAPAKP